MGEPTDELVDTLATRLRMPAERVRALHAGRWTHDPTVDTVAEGIAKLELWANRSER